MSRKTIKRTNPVLSFLKSLRNLNFGQKLFFIILLFTVPPFVTFLPIYYRNSFEVRVSRAIEKYEHEMDKAADEFNSIMFLYRMHLNYIKNHPSLETILTVSLEDDYQGFVLSFMDFKNDIIKLAVNDLYKSSINVYTFNENVYDAQYSQSIRLLDDDLIGKIVNKDKLEIISGYREGEGSTPGAGYLCLYDYIQYIDTPLGIAEIRLPLQNAVDSFIFDIPDNSFLVFLPAYPAGQVIVNSNNISENVALKHIAEFEEGGTADGFIAIPIISDYTGDRFALFLPVSFIYAEAINFLVLNLIIFIFFLLAVLISIKLTTSRVTARLTHLVAHVENNLYDIINGGEFKLLGGNDEFSRIDTKFYELVSNINEYYKKLSNYENQKNALQLMLLQERINPHFLYNTLSSIKWAYPNEGLEHIVDSMVKYYRIALNRGNEILTVKQEIDMVEAYIRIQKFAYQSDFTYSINMQSEICGLKIIKHIFQPIVENSIMHGIVPLDSGGRLDITGVSEDGKMKISIVDNGVGMEEETVERLLSGSYQSMNGGYGVKNVLKRLDIYYKGEYAVTITSCVDKGTRVLLELPFEPRHGFSWVEN